MTMLRRSRSSFLALVLVASAALAGCIAPPEDRSDPGVAPAGTSAPPAEGEMTAEESVEEREGQDTGNLIPRFFAERVVTVTGTMDLERLPVDLATFNGEIVLDGASGNAWSLVATLRGTGFTPQEAKANLDAIAFEWSHERDGGHHLAAKAEPEESAGLIAIHLGGRAATLALVLPSDVVLTLSAATSNGNVAVTGVPADAVSLATSNGNVAVTGVTADSLAAGTSNGNVDVTGVTATVLDLATSNGNVAADAEGVETVSIGTSSGNVDARLVPGASGAIQVGTSNGNAIVRVPEADAFGYRAALATTNGNARVELEDGDAHAEDGPGGAAATFTTSGYNDRAIQVTVDVASSNGNVALERA